MLHFLLRSYSRWTILPLICVALFGCEFPKGEISRKVEIKQVDGQYDFYVNGQKFEIKGAGLDFNSGQDFQALATAGANTFRTWSTDHAEMELDSASKYNLKIAMGLEMDKELHGFDYEDTEAVQAQLERLKQEVLKYKDHPALLCWVVGNELNLLIREDGSLGVVNPKAYDALNEIVQFIHEVDPHHPVTTTFAAGARLDHIQVALERCPSLDFLSYQVYNELATLPQQEMANGLDIPYVVSEFGPKGHWEMPATAWGREIEENSTQKADGLKARIQQGLESDTTGRNMGGFAFIWGQKQERTPTWYGIFNKDGRPTAVLDELTKYWTGSYPVNRAPVIQSMTLNVQESSASISLTPRQVCAIRVKSFDYEKDKLTFQWRLMQEVETRSLGGAHEKEPEYLEIEVLEEENGFLKFRAPATSGEYRLFCYLYDAEKVANANIPFLVE
ncbi:glycoside hydrolase family 2 TIM barrel-domain containing protein [Pontibacter sp. G13]|uniref:glycoside hydrolase family 2 TIM barrel-domain containing protein n=1 Tax=Pontibacter sp. G13 TaxID=3074898 RepID=UPI002889FD87|nr:glycoside hydrolase family 2 TIM barrel-domain containing protein [Pontibacter sp. G13]WNJ19052.1 glycoside hydrolase family 2 TIM barrel-domain containing protein [Pontibacter sp. G13]